MKNKQELLEKSIELTSFNTLPPSWVDSYEDCQSLLKQVDSISNTLNNLEKQIS